MKRSPMPRRRRPIRSRSEQATAVRSAAQPVVDAVFGRDGGCVAAALPVDVAGWCRGRLTPHHLRKAWKGSGWLLDNLVTLCEAHNGWVEDEPDTAHALGLVLREGEIYHEVWDRMAAAGLPVGRSVPCCPGTDEPPLTENGGLGQCSACRLVVTLNTAPDGGPGPVVSSHSWHPPTLRD